MKIDNDKSQRIKEFYNEFSKKQVATGINLRHYYLYKRIIGSGLKKHHNVLEIGCGIGTLTGLLAKYLKNGKIFATDISTENIELAKERLNNNKNIDFLVSDMQDFSVKETFDFVVLADVIEHIPVEFHERLFNTIFKHLNRNSVVFINVPHPKGIEFFRKYSPEKLQIIDQALYASDIIKNAETNGLILYEYKSYSLFHKENDYVMIIFKMNNDLSYNTLSKRKIIFKKSLNRLYYLLTNLK